MSIIIFAIIVLIVGGLLAGAVQYMPVIPGTFKSLILLLIFVACAVVIAQRAGVF